MKWPLGVDTTLEMYLMVARPLGLRRSLRQIDNPFAWKANEPRKDVTVTPNVDQLGRDGASQTVTWTRRRRVRQHPHPPQTPPRWTSILGRLNSQPHNQELEAYRRFLRNLSTLADVFLEARNQALQQHNLLGVGTDL